MGKLIVFEGIDGSGKSTQVELMCFRFSTEARNYVRVTFPRYSEPSSALIKMYLSGQFGDDPDSVNAYAASSFFAVDRYASYKQDWGKHYQNGGIVLTDRYTTSNAIHQGAKVSPEQRERFFKWLHEYEFMLMGLPSPDMVIYLDIEAEQAAQRLSRRQTDTGVSGDIHEKDLDYLTKCVIAGRQAASFYGWHTVKCYENGVERGVNAISSEIYNIIAAKV